MELLSRDYVLEDTATHTRTTINPQALNIDDWDCWYLLHLAYRMSIVCGAFYDPIIFMYLGLVVHAEQARHPFECGF